MFAAVFRRSMRALAATAVIAASAATVLLSVSWLTESSLLSFRPFLNDEVYYWHQTATATAAGLNGGFYTVEELTAPSSIFRFGPHGPLFPLLYSLPARLVGWHRASAPLFNIVWLTVSAAAFVALARPGTARTWLAAALVATFWPIAFWAASNMQESFHQGIALVLAGAAIALGRRERIGLVVAAIVIAIALLTRLSWGVVVPGLLLLVVPTRTGARIPLIVGASVVLVAAAVIAFTSTAPPMPSGFGFLRVGVSDGSTFLSSHLSDNASRLLDFGDDYDPLELLHRVEYVVMTIVLVTAAALAWWRDRAISETRTAHLVAQASNLAGIVVAMALLYALTNWTEHRVISAHLLLATLVMIALPGRFGPLAAGALIAANMAGAGVYARSFSEDHRENFTWDRRGLRQFEEVAAPHLRYDPAVGPWCNTMLSSQYPPDFIAVPPGLGISITRETEDMRWPPRSRYLLLDPSAQRRAPGPLHATPLATLPYGTLFLNLDANCPSPRAGHE